MTLGFTVHGHAVGIGWIIALGVAIAAFVFLVFGGTSMFALTAMILALAIAYLIG